MARPSFISIPLVIVLLAAGCATQEVSPDAAGVTEARAVEFLKHEVPAWSRANGCFSCHNNGDAARALFAASQKGYRIPAEALADTTEWVARPDRWDHNKGDPGFSDQRLADVQFAASLLAAMEAGAVKNLPSMQAAARKVAQAQAEDGSWPVDAANNVGSPATYGVALATYMAWKSLTHAPLPETSTVIAKAEAKLGSIPPDSVPSAVVRLLFLRSRRGNEVDQANPPQQSPSPHVVGYEASLDFLRRAQTSDGGWGPYADSPPEAFDTALALLALAEFRSETGVTEIIQRGRQFLTMTQLPDGSWPATTRPSGGQSYAQQMSTTGWATLALLATR